LPPCEQLERALRAHHVAAVRHLPAADSHIDALVDEIGDAVVKIQIEFDLRVKIQ
jgi:hypothetical protein